MYCRYDKIIIDSRYTTDIVKAEDADGVHMYAQGHMVNHGTAADVSALQAPFMWLNTLCTSSSGRSDWRT